MSRRKPNIAPHLSNTTSKNESTFNQRRRGIIPSQTTLSVQNVPDYSTPAGAAQANEEFRRLRMGIESLKQEQQPNQAQQQMPVRVTPKPVVVTPDDKNDDNPDLLTLWALTLLKNSVPVNDIRVVQALNFLRDKLFYSDKGPEFKIPIEFKITKAELQEYLKTNDDAVQMNIIANAITYFVDWFYLLPQGKDSIQLVNIDDEEGNPLRIEYGIFKGLNLKKYQLVNDEDLVDPNYFYGTNAWGLKGWYPLPSTTSSDKTYVHSQTTLSTQWHVIHNLDKMPSVNAEDSNGVDMSGTVEYINNNELYYHFKNPTKGFLYCN